MTKKDRELFPKNTHSSVLCCCDKCPRRKTTEERWVLAHGFRGFNSWLLGLLQVSEVSARGCLVSLYLDLVWGNTSQWEHGAKQGCSPPGQPGSREGEGWLPITLWRTHTNALIPSPGPHLSALPRPSSAQTVNQAFNADIYPGHVLPTVWIWAIAWHLFSQKALICLHNSVSFTSFKKAREALTFHLSSSLGSSMSVAWRKQTGLFCLFLFYFVTGL